MATRKSPSPKPESPTFMVKAGGTKGAAIVAILCEDPALSRAAIAEKVGATVGRVGEVIRLLAAEGSRAEKKAVAAHKKAQARR